MNKPGIELDAVDFTKDSMVFKLDGKPCFAMRYDSIHAKGFVGYKSIEDDLDHCLHCLEYLDAKQEHDPGIDTWACTIAFLITYGRCFTSSDGRRASLATSHIPKDCLESHERVMSLRHRYVAHASGHGEGSVNLVALYPNKRNMKVLSIAPPMLARISGLNGKLRNDIKKVGLLEIEWVILGHFKAEATCK